MPREFTRSKKRVAQRFKKPTPEYLSNVALYYLGRFAASEASLRRVLENRIRRAAMQNAEFSADTETKEKLSQAIDKIVAGHIESGVVNDKSFAEMKTTGMRRSGTSARRITQKLQSKGIDSSIISNTLEPEEGSSAEDEEMNAAKEFARRRKLGAYRKNPTATEIDRRKLAIKEYSSMARAGFSGNVVRKILNMEIEDEE